LIFLIAGLAILCDYYIRPWWQWFDGHNNWKSIRFARDSGNCRHWKFAIDSTAPRNFAIISPPKYHKPSQF
jgi:hypothetical protein